MELRPFTLPNLLTFLRLVALPFLVVAILEGRHRAALAIFLAAFSRRLRHANATIEGLAALDVKSRLARYFRELAATRGKKAGGGWAVVVRPSQREIADTIGSSRETVSRTMSQMAEQQLIVPKGRVVYVRLDSGEGAPPGGAPGAGAA